MKVLFTGGGTGGHIVPIIAVARELRKAHPPKKLQLFYLGPKDEFGSVLLSQEGIKVKKVLAGKIRRYFNWKSILQNIADILFKIPLGIIQAFFSVFFLSPDVIFSKGGYGSIPGVVSGKMLFVPVILHESDVAPGAANKFLSKFVSKVFVSFPKTEYFPLKKIIEIGNPVRREVMEGPEEEAKDFFKLNSQKPILLILGGSQGSQRVNDKILEVLPQLLESFEIIHQCGEKNFQEVRAGARVVISQDQRKLYHLYPFLKEPGLRKAYVLADLVISRAGSGIIFEIAAASKPSILIPLPGSAQNHQVKNAYAYAEAGGCLVIEETNFTPRFFLERLKSLFAEPEKLREMAKRAKAFSKPQAAKVIAEHLCSFSKN